jgi:hypothetical protein
MAGPMTDRPVPPYIVSVFEKPHWRRLLTTKDKVQAEALEQATAQDGVKAQIEEITPKVKRRRERIFCGATQRLGCEGDWQLEAAGS